VRGRTRVQIQSNQTFAIRGYSHGNSIGEYYSAGSWAFVISRSLLVILD
jgi:hypothetical protein